MRVRAKEKREGEGEEGKLAGSGEKPRSYL